MAAPTVDNSNSVTVASGTSATVNAPSNMVPGDMLVLVLYSNGSTITAPTPTYGPAWINLTNTTGYAFWVKPVVSEPATYTVTWSTSSAAVLMVTLIKGTSGILGWDVYGSFFSTSSANIQAPSITTAKNATSLLLNVYTTRNGTAITLPGGQTSSGAINADGYAGVFGWENLSALGATGTRTATSGSANNVGASIAFQAPYGSIVNVNTQFISGKENKVYTIPSWVTGAGSTTGPMAAYPNQGRLIPFWLFDSGVGPNSSAGGSTNISQLSVSVANNVNSAMTNPLTCDVSGTISGIVTINGVPQGNVLVCLYYRPSGIMIKSTRTDSSGAYSFTGLQVGQPLYFVVAESPNTGTYNSMIFDIPLPT